MKRNSWHFALAKFGSMHFEHKCSNLTICTYAQFVLTGFVLVLVQILAFSLLTICLIGGIIPWIAFMVINEMYISPDALAGLNIVSLLAAFIASVMLFLVIWFQNNYETVFKDSFIFNLLQSKKEKFCKTINFD